MPKLGTVLRVSGKIAAIAAQVALGTPITQQQPEDPPSSIHEISVQTVLDNLPSVIQAAIASYERGDDRPLSQHLSAATVEVERWLTAEAARYTPSSK